jgi:hypothetical protein
MVGLVPEVVLGFCVGFIVLIILRLHFLIDVSRLYDSRLCA